MRSLRTIFESFSDILASELGDSGIFGGEHGLLVKHPVSKMEVGNIFWGKPSWQHFHCLCERTGIERNNL